MAKIITNSSATKRIAVVTGSNKGVGFGICRNLASNGVSVVLTARDEKRGLEALENLQNSGVSDVVFHQLDVTDSTSIASFANFIKTHFGKLDILVNNAATGGSRLTQPGALKDLKPFAATQAIGNQVDWNRITKQTYESVEECLKTNYYGARGVTEALIPLLQLSNSPRIVNVTSSMGKLRHIPSERVREVLSDKNSLTEERVDDLVTEFLKDFKEEALEIKGWPVNLSAYIVSKAALNAYTRILAKKMPNFYINCVSPGYVKTDLTFNSGVLTVDEGAENPARLALLPDGGPSGCFFVQKDVSSFD